MTNDERTILQQQEGGVLTLTMNRPDVLNALNAPMLDELGAAFDAAATDPSVRCIVLRGAGRGFGSGQDLHAFQENADQSSSDIGGNLAKYHRIALAIRNLPKPVIAAVHGACAGASCNLALACDLRIAADSARFIEAFARIGLVPDAGGAWFLPRLVGTGKALEMALLADEVNGPEAERLGLVNRCVPAADFERTVNDWAQRLANGPTMAYGLIKQLMYRSQESDLATSLQMEGPIQGQAIATQDHREGVAAFLQKRMPQYRGQ